jgi:hypothetical protein
LTWPEAAEYLRNAQNAYWDSTKTYHEINLGPAGIMPYTNQFYAPWCLTQAWNEGSRSWVIQCEVGILADIVGTICTMAGCFDPAPEYHLPPGGGLWYFRLYDNGTIGQV